METAPLTLSSSLGLLQTPTGHKPTVIINHRNNTITFHQPSLFSSGHLQVMCGHKCRHVVKAVGINGGDEHDGIKRTRGAVGATVVLACVIGAMCFTSPMCRPALAIWLLQSTVSDRTPETLAGLLTAHRPKNKREVVEAKEKFYKVLIPRIEFPDLKAAGRLVVLSGDEKAGVVVQKLRAVYEDKKLKNAGGEELGALGLALVELLIFQVILSPQELRLREKYVDAETLLTELELERDLPPNNADLKLYKALISIMQGRADAEELWKGYEKAVGKTSEKDTKFQQFKAQMLKLKRK